MADVFSETSKPQYNVSGNQIQPQTYFQQPSNSHLIKSATLGGSSNDGASIKKPRDARLIHMILANLGVTAYQERVPLQLLDFAYRYTSSTLQDALHLTAENYGMSSIGTGTGKSGAGPNAAHIEAGGISINALRLSIASRTHYQYNPTLPKDFYQELAQERNRIVLPSIQRSRDMELPDERYCLTGTGWTLKDEWENDYEVDDSGKEGDQPRIEEMLEAGLEADEEGEDGGSMEDVFGASNEIDIDLEMKE
ncbi:Transcription initiation factor TFIID subunit 9 [Agyrium rufum]|nr:Transcription initiation factor TFIID subunit 9 [Agyrium rufum]